MSTEDNSTEVSTSEKILELISLAEEAQALINNFYYMELSGEIRRDRVQEGKLKLIELRAAVVSLGETTAISVYLVYVSLQFIYLVYSLYIM